MYSDISVGPVAQLSPRERMGMARRVESAASMVVPMSMVPCCSMVTETQMGMSSVVFVGIGEGVEAGVYGALDLLDVLAGFDEECVCAARDEAAGLLVVGVEHGWPVGVGEGEEFGAGSDGAEHEARFVWSGEFVAGFARDLDGGFVEGEGFGLEVELGEDEFCLSRRCRSRRSRRRRRGMIRGSPG